MTAFRAFFALPPLVLVLVGGLVLGFFLPPLVAQSQKAPSDLPVIVAAARLEAFADPVEALGTLKALESVNLTANVTETVFALHFDDGQRVAAGEVLVEMTSAEEHALLVEGQARVAEAERQFDRVKALVTQRAASESLLDERRRDLDAARAQLVAIESRLADRLIKAPFAGVIGLRNISPGALVRPGDLIATLDDDSRMKLDFALPSRYLPDLQPGLVIQARTQALGERVFSGAIAAIDSRVDPVTRAVQVRALLPNEDRDLKPGLLMQVEVPRNPRQSLAIPEAALLQRGKDHRVLVVGAGDQVEERRVVIGARRPGKVEVTTGLTAGERVITHGTDKVRPGQVVRVQAVDDGSRSLKELLDSAP
ncbi:MAG TPA: efflux RND transporter periplasmic adaptor subunit [Chromatiaceae bacterium]|nr:efflux RND transporter periplasmic adaptor subunit [Chromatiaceae bacterium]